MLVLRILLHGKLRIGCSCAGRERARALNTPGCTPAAVRCLPCSLKTFVTCPVAAAEVARVSATWRCLTGYAGPAHIANFYPANDRRAWAPSSFLREVWQQLRYAMLTCLLVSSHTVIFAIVVQGHLQAPVLMGAALVPRRASTPGQLSNR